MNTLELAKERRSVRTFDGKPLTVQDREAVAAFIESIPNPFGLPVEFILLDAKENGLYSPVIKGETLYVAAKTEKAPHSEEAFGYSFEQLVLFAQSLGIGTTWIGGTFKREIFEKAANVQGNEKMYCASPLGYPAKKMSVIEATMRKGVRADKRKDADELFFDRDFQTPLKTQDKTILDALEAVRLAPSAVNMQPWRIVADGSRYHFFLSHKKGYDANADWDIQAVDMGIALCHFMNIAGGTVEIANPGIECANGIDYAVSVVV
ncbi:MAG: nitroreductase [Clostridia bacterium]|nr:nitroreductase [Clostridia bacterium]